MNELDSAIYRLENASEDLQVAKELMEQESFKEYNIIVKNVAKKINDLNDKYPKASKLIRLFCEVNEIVDELVETKERMVTYEKTNEEPNPYN